MKHKLLSVTKWLLIMLVMFAVISAVLYTFTTPRQDRNWTPEHAVLPHIEFKGDSNNPDILVTNVRDFKWQDNDKIHYKNMQFSLNDVVELKAVVSHFSAISGIAHVFLIFVLDDGRELGLSIEARREVGEPFSIQGGLLARFEIMTVLATPEDLLGIRKIHQEEIHVYPIKESKEKARQLFKLIAKDVNSLYEKPEMYHLFFKNCTNQIVKHVSTLTDQSYPWFFQTLAPGDTGKILFELGLIDLPDTSFDAVQAKTLLK